MDECLDLVAGLPDGSLYVAATQPERAWSEERELAVAIRQQVLDAAESLHGVPAEERTRIPTPRDAALRRLEEARQKARAENAKRAGEYIRNTKWEAV